jgi:hypothetical protein
MIPKITDERLTELLIRIKVVHHFEKELYYIKPVDPRRIAFTWDPIKDGEAKGLKILKQIYTYHDYGHPALFKPSIAEVLAQIPEDVIDEVVAFETQYVDFDEGNDCHIACTILYSAEASNV